ncbi:MAG: thiamine diphosphokinase [Bacteroidota bacterium]
MTKRALIIANGEPPRKQLLQTLARESDCVVCADGGANTALKFGILPHAIVGDMDSIHAETLAKFRAVPQHTDTDQDSTDLEKVVQWTIREGYDHITVAAGLGKRLDHTVGNLGVMAKFYPDAVIRFVDDLGELSYVGRSTEFEAKIGSTISLIPLNRCDGVTTAGLRYALTNESLELGFRHGTSNEIISNPVLIAVKSGHLILFRLHTGSH